MEYTESNITELKLIVNDEVKTEIIAFLNSYLGWVIYVGVNDNGEIIKEIESDALEIKDDALEMKNDALEIESDALEIELAIITLIRNNPKITRKEMTQKIGKSLKTIERVLKNSEIIKRVGSKRYGKWIIKEWKN